MPVRSAFAAGRWVCETASTAETIPLFELIGTLTTPTIAGILIAAYVLYLLPLLVWIIMQRREPVSTLSWVLTLAALPYLGFLIYYLLGPQRITRRLRRRHRSHQVMDEKRHAAGIGNRADARQIARLAERAGGMPSSSSTRVDLLVDGIATYAALLDAIAAAEHHVHLEYYIFEPDGIGTRVRDTLIERALAGVQVRLLVDALGSSRLRRTFLRPLREAGVEFAWFHRTHLLRLIHARPKWNLRTHRKIVVIDGHIGFTGGINIADCHDETLDCGRFHDLHLRLEGRSVQWLQLAFLEDWHYATARIPRDECFWPPLAVGPIATQVLPCGPDTPWEPIHRLQVALIQHAQARVWLATPYFVPGEAARFALTSAAMRGLDVRLILPAPRHSDSQLVSAAARSYYDELLAAGVRIYHFRDRMTHGKALLVDDNEVVIGSANFDQRSFRLNFELSVRISDAAFIARVERQLGHDIAQSDEIDENRLRGGFGERFLVACARLLSPIL